jgi:hypothetical protein
MSSSVFEEINFIQNRINRLSKDNARFSTIELSDCTEAGLFADALPKPDHCCCMGSYECQVPMPILGKVRGIDYCIADIVAALNAAGVYTSASCCGHGKMDGIISLEDGREILIKNIKGGDRGNEKK